MISVTFVSLTFKPAGFDKYKLVIRAIRIESLMDFGISLLSKRQSEGIMIANSR